jgi:hypothetical protein
MRKMMKTTMIINFLWSLIMVSAFAYLVHGRYSDPRAILLTLGVAYAVISFFALVGRRWAIGIPVIIAILLMIRWLPMVGINTWMFMSGHELYQDSPATILVVLSYAVVFAIPSTILCSLYLVQRKQIWGILRNGASIA